jgi:hypothetical protein
MPVLESMLTLKVLLLVLAAVLAIRLGPFDSGDAWPAILTGMTLVSAMAIQNAVQRIHLGTNPPTTIMTGTTTQLMIDFADAIHGLPSDRRAASRACAEWGLRSLPSRSARRSEPGCSPRSRVGVSCCRRHSRYSRAWE